MEKTLGVLSGFILITAGAVVSKMLLYDLPMTGGINWQDAALVTLFSVVPPLFFSAIGLIAGLFKR